MSTEKQYLIKRLFDGILEHLIKEKDGSFIFSNKKYQFSSSITQFRLMSDDECPDLPTKEELCDYFEKKILSIIPYATLFIKDNLSIIVNIEKDPMLLKKIYLAKKELDIYESLKTLFFPTMKEYVAKFGDYPPEIIYSPSRKFRVEIYNIKEDNKNKGIRFISPEITIMKSMIDNTAIDFLIDDVSYFISNFKFQNPIEYNAKKLPQKDVTREELKLIPERKKKGFYLSEFYSYAQKIKFIKKLFEDFLEYYPYIIENNFPRIKKAFSLYNDLPIKITIYIEKTLGSWLNPEDLGFQYTFKKLLKDSCNQVELKEIQELNNDHNEYIRHRSTLFSTLLIIHDFRGFNLSNIFAPTEFHYRYLAERNALPFTYRFIKEELDDIIEKIQTDTIFDEINPFVSHADSWIQRILEVEKRGNEDDYIELKLTPTESSKKDGSGNDIYSEINAFENGKGGYLFIGVNESKRGLEKIVGLESYFRDNKKNLDMVKREIIDKCIKYLGRTHHIDADEYEGKTLIRIKIQSNYGQISYFKPENGRECAFIRENGKKRIMKSYEIAKRYVRNQE